jgi:hypothetical protein
VRGTRVRLEAEGVEHKSAEIHHFFAFLLISTVAIVYRGTSMIDRGEDKEFDNDPSLGVSHGPT